MRVTWCRNKDTSARYYRTFHKPQKNKDLDRLNQAEGEKEDHPSRT